MFKILLITLVLTINVASATCTFKLIHCEPPVAFQNAYELETVRCAPPRGPVIQTSKFRIFNLLMNQCGPVPNENCLKPVFEAELNTSRHLYFQADLRMDGEEVVLKIDDRRFLHQGDINLSTPNADYMTLSNYICNMKQ